MAVIGASPVTFISEDAASSGKQYQIPLSLLSFDATGTTIDPSAWTPFAGLASADQTLLKSLFASLVSQRFLTKPSS
jgi:hypothetical protein